MGLGLGSRAGVGDGALLGLSGTFGAWGDMAGLAEWGSGKITADDCSW